MHLRSVSILCAAPPGSGFAQAKPAEFDRVLALNTDFSIGVVPGSAFTGTSTGGDAAVPALKYKL